MRRLLIKTALAVFGIAALVSLGGYIYLRRSLPVVDGSLQVNGVSAPVDIVRDADAVPHIFAATRLDALFGLGYVHAQDRLWQMEFQRRIGQGRLSEIFGGATLVQDRFLRTVGFGRAAKAAWDHLPDDARKAVEAYVAGVNAFISTHHGSALPPEFTLLRFEPEPWTGPDVLAWVKMMAWDLSANYSFELLRHDIAARVGADRMAALFPPYPVDGLNILGGGVDSHLVVGRSSQGPHDPGGDPKRVALQSATAWQSAFASSLGSPDSPVRNFLLDSRSEALGSNNWVVDGTLTASGKPLLANDPHLAAHIPSLWYLAHMSAGDFDVAGATLPGTPAVAIGRNGSIAWGETNVAADVEDLFLERLDSSGTHAEFQGREEPIKVLKETISVKGGGPVTVDVRITRHGPLVSDALNANIADQKTGPKPPPFEPFAFRWTALDEDDSTLVAFLQLNQAHNWSEFTAALRSFVVPAQNFVYADVDGHIGYYIPGRIPIRAQGDGSSPVDGSSGTNEWTGWIPFEELPHVLDPPSHFIVTANNRPEPADYPHFIALEYPNPYRAQRISDLLRHRGAKLTPDDFRAIQADTVSTHAHDILPMLLRHAHPQDESGKTAIDLLKRWNFDVRGDSVEGAIFEAWFLQLAPTILGDDLGDSLPGYARRFSYVTRFVTELLEHPDASSAAWCDDQRTSEHESCDDAMTKALHDGVAALAKAIGSDSTRWRWDAAHRAIFPHSGLDTVPVLHSILSRSMPNGGDWSTVNVGAVDVEHLFEQHDLPGYRQIIDLSPQNDSRFLDAVGQSGHFLSPHYDDSIQRWHDVAHVPMRMSRDVVEKGATGHLRLTPSVVGRAF